MSDYRFPYQDAEFVLKELVDFDGLFADTELQDINADLAVAVLDEAAKMGAEELAPLNRFGDSHSANLTENGVQETQFFKDAYRQFAEGGWMSLPADENYGGQALPNLLSTAVNEIWHAANMAFALCPMLTQGAIEALSHHGSDALKQRYLNKMISGEWTGTMNLTEADAGSDLAAIQCKAVPDGDDYLISGQKIFITWGDHQMTDNIIHLVLARLPGSPPGVKGISLFVVPKFQLDDAGNPGERNRVNCLSLEHKLGIHASPTCVMEFDLARGQLVGEANKGLSYMFTMMNHARQTVGLQGLSIAERAYQQARQYARDRLQGSRKDGSKIALIEFPDVRRMLMQMKSTTEAMRALAYTAAAEVDRSRHAKEGEQRQQHHSLVEFYTPIVKGWLTEMAQELTSLNIQIHGGMGFIEETGAAQHYRDARILTIYEGTTGIQALDLAGRKILMNQGNTLARLLDEMHTTLHRWRASGLDQPQAMANFQLVLAETGKVRDWLLAADRSREDVGGASVNLLMMLGYLCGGWLMAESALKAKAQIDAAEGDPDFLGNKLISCRFYGEQLLPRALGHSAAILAGSDSIMALDADAF